MNRKYITLKRILIVFLVAMLSITQAAMAFSIQTQSESVVQTGDLRIDVDTEGGYPVARIGYYQRDLSKSK